MKKEKLYELERIPNHAKWRLTPDRSGIVTLSDFFSDYKGKTILKYSSAN